MLKYVSVALVYLGALGIKLGVHRAILPSAWNYTERDSVANNKGLPFVGSEFGRAYGTLFLAAAGLIAIWMLWPCVGW